MRYQDLRGFAASLDSLAYEAECLGLDDIASDLRGKALGVETLADEAYDEEMDEGEAQDNG